VCVFFFCAERIATIVHVGEQCGRPSAVGRSAHGRPQRDVDCADARVFAPNRLRCATTKTLNFVFLLTAFAQISSLRVVHIAGTKGKGSTSAFVERILRECGLRTGLYTSPHLRFETERFRINGVAVTDELFAEHFWKCYDRLSASCTPDLGMPTWFRMVCCLLLASLLGAHLIAFRQMTLLCLDMFVAQRLDVAVIEVGVGGRADATTVVDVGQMHRGWLSRFAD
jgi:hypothetical protein